MVQASNWRREILRGRQGRGRGQASGRARRDLPRR